MQEASTSGSGIRLSNGLPLAGGGQPSGRSASNSARCLTPMVSLRPQAGQRPSRRIVSEGSRQTAQARCPSR